MGNEGVAIDIGNVVEWGEMDGKWMRYIYRFKELLESIYRLHRTDKSKTPN